MNSVRRWSLVALVTAVLVATPLLVGLIPANGSRVSSDELRRRITASASVGWSGEVITRGTLQVPNTVAFGGVVNLLGEDNTLRVWWGDAEHWRVDNIRQSGEADLFRSGTRTTRWVFESNTATITPYSAVRLPDPSDVLPTRLAARLLAGATAKELTRLSSRRVAGRSAAGLRLVPSSPASTIDHVDMWADDTTGLPLRVEVFGKGDSLPVVTSALSDVTLQRPSADILAFRAPPSAKVRQRESIDVAAAANAFAPFVLPDRLATLARRSEQQDLGAVGVYGRGPTALLAIPVRRGLASRVRSQLKSATSSRENAVGTALGVGPLSVLLTRGSRSKGTFLLAGTVTPMTLEKAAVELGAEVASK